MREFVIFSRIGKTNAQWKNLHDAGRLDIVHECIVASLFLSHGIRKNVVFHAVLNGPPNPPLHLKICGEKLHNVRTDQQTWTQILKKVLSRKQHPGINVSKTSFEALIRIKAQNSQIYVLEENGKDINQIQIAENPVFILGDHVGLPKKVESFALRFGQKVSLGKKPYLAAACITILNYILDRKK
jgi:tRNA (pseudouridine54-N1)-methyltransferase